VGEGRERERAQETGCVVTVRVVRRDGLDGQRCRRGESRADEKNKNTPGILDGFVLTWWVWEDVQPSSMLLSWPVAI
jgi:hypothetical protein